MLKNFSPHSLGINGRQSELIELALTYGFRSMDVDLADMFRRSQRTSPDDAAKYLRATELLIGGFDLGINLDADDDGFTSQLGALHPLADFAAQLEAKRAYALIPAATDSMSYPEFFEVQKTRLSQIAEVLSARDIQLAVGFKAGKELDEGKQYPFVRNVEGFVALVSQVPGAGLYLDTWDWVVGDGAMDQLSELKADDIVAVRLGSVPADVDLAKATSLDRVLPEKEGGAESRERRQAPDVDRLQGADQSDRCLGAVQGTDPRKHRAKSTGSSRWHLQRRRHEDRTAANGTDRRHPLRVNQHTGVVGRCDPERGASRGGATWIMRTSPLRGWHGCFVSCGPRVETRGYSPVPLRGSPVPARSR